LSRTDPATGRPKKRKFGPWVFKAMAMLAALRSLRGSSADPFGYTRERRTERAIAAEFLADMMQLSEGLSASSHERAVALARLAQDVRGFGPVKEAAMATYVERRAALRDAPMIIPANAVGQAKAA
jgi:indolepyruvate ferredoxin oxidoreductase